MEYMIVFKEPQSDFDRRHDDAYWGAKVVSFVRMRSGHGMPGPIALREACKGRMAAYEVPKEFLPWEGEWPVTPEGKIDFKSLLKKALELLAPER